MSIKATYDKGATSAPATGAWQYDAGQKMYLYGIPQNLKGTIELQFAYQGDAKTESRVAEWDAAEKAWTASVPNKYLQRSAPVSAYLYATLDEDTAETLYTAVFTPQGRPATGGEVTEDEKNAWGELVGQVTLKLAEMEEAISRANGAAQDVTERLNTLTVKETEWEQRMNAAEANAQEAKEAAQDAASQASAARDAADASAQAAQATAQGAQDTAQAAQNRADAAVLTADGALSQAMSAKTTADKALSKVVGTHYWAMGPYMFSVSTTGWTYDETNDRYYQDFSVPGMTAAMMPFASSSKIGGKFPMCGCESAADSVRIYMTDVPEVSGFVTVYGLEETE